MTRDLLYGGIEAGGTKFICAVADEDLNIIDKCVLIRRFQKKPWVN